MTIQRIRGRGMGDWISDALQQIQSGTQAGAAGSNPNFVNQGDVVNFTLQVSWPWTFYTASTTQDFANRLANAGLRPTAAIEDSQVSTFFGGRLAGQVQATHGFGPANPDVANLIAGIATTAGFSVSYTGGSPFVEITRRAQPPQYAPRPGEVSGNVVQIVTNPIYTPTPRDDDSSNGILEEIKKLFNVDGATLAVVAVVVIAFIAYRD